MRNAGGWLHIPAEIWRSKGQNAMKEEFLCRMYNLLNTHSGNVVTYRYVNSRRKVLGMLRDSVRMLHEISTTTSLQGRFTDSECDDEQIVMCSCSA
jgi:hypothetical protein